MRLKKFSEKLPAVLYSVYVLKTNLDNKDIYAIKNKLNRIKKKYSYISFLLVISNTSSKFCVRRKLKIKNKQGRPKEIVLGEKIEKHVHLCILGDENNSAYKCIKELQKTFNKRFGDKKSIFYSKGDNIRAKKFINYSLKQASNISMYGIFNDIIEKNDIIKTDYL